MHGNAGLADSPLAHQDHDGHRQPGFLAGPGQVLVDPADLLGPAGEIPQVGGEQARGQSFQRLKPDRHGGRIQGLVGDQDGALEVLQAFARLNAQLVDHCAAALPVELERLGDSVAAVKSEHQLTAQLLSEREFPHQFGELADQFVMPAQVEFEVDAVLIDGDALLVQAAGGQPDELTVDAVERGPPAEPERVTVAGYGLVKVTRVASRASRGHERLELPGVKPLAVSLKNVAMRVGGDNRLAAIGTEQAPERGDADLGLGPGRRRQILTVDRLEQPVRGDDSVRAEQERGDDDLLPGTTQLEPFRGSRDLKRPENPKLHQRLRTGKHYPRDSVAHYYLMRP